MVIKNIKRKKKKEIASVHCEQGEEISRDRAEAERTNTED